MKMRFTALTCFTVLFAFSGAGAFAQQNRNDQKGGEHSQF